MKIVDRQTFLAMPAGTVFSTYEPVIFGPLMIKGETIHGGSGKAIDFFEQQIADAVECDDSGEFMDVLEAARCDGGSFRMDLETESREGLFDDDQLYAVWEKDDLVSLIKRLKRCL